MPPGGGAPARRGRPADPADAEALSAAVVDLIREAVAVRPVRRGEYVFIEPSTALQAAKHRLDRQLQRLRSGTAADAALSEAALGALEAALREPEPCMAVLAAATTICQVAGASAICAPQVAAPRRPRAAAGRPPGAGRGALGGRRRRLGRGALPRGVLWNAATPSPDSLRALCPICPTQMLGRPAFVAALVGVWNGGAQHDWLARACAAAALAALCTGDSPAAVDAQRRVAAEPGAFEALGAFISEAAGGAGAACGGGATESSGEDEYRLKVALSAVSVLSMAVAWPRRAAVLGPPVALAAALLRIMRGDGDGGGGDRVGPGSPRFAALHALLGLAMEERGERVEIRDDAFACFRRHAPGLAAAVAPLLPVARLRNADAARRGGTPLFSCRAACAAGAAAGALGAVPGMLPLELDLLMHVVTPDDVPSVVSAAAALLLDGGGGEGPEGGGGAHPGGAKPFNDWAACVVANACLRNSGDCPLAAAALGPDAARVLAAAEAAGAAAGLDPPRMAALRAARRARAAAAAAPTPAAVPGGASPQQGAGQPPPPARSRQGIWKTGPRFLVNFHRSTGRGRPNVPEYDAFTCETAGGRVTFKCLVYRQKPRLPARH
jgi:hypothetical protein